MPLDERIPRDGWSIQRVPLLLLVSFRIVSTTMKTVDVATGQLVSIRLHSIPSRSTYRSSL